MHLEADNYHKYCRHNLTILSALPSLPGSFFVCVCWYLVLFLSSSLYLSTWFSSWAKSLILCQCYLPEVLPLVSQLFHSPSDAVCLSGAHVLNPNRGPPLSAESPGNKLYVSKHLFTVSTKFQIWMHFVLTHFHKPQPPSIPAPPLFF